MSEITLQRIDDYRWRLPQTEKMRVPGVVYTDVEMIKELGNEEAPKRVVKIAHLPDILKDSLAMSDVHWGYGFPIGALAALDWDKGIVSPGSVGCDISEGLHGAGRFQRGKA